MLSYCNNHLHLVCNLNQWRPHHLGLSVSQHFFASLLLALLSIHHRRQPNRPPPGPRPLPIIGNLNLIGALPHHSIHALSKTYGPLMQLRFGSIPVVVASSVDTAEAILKTHDLRFVSRHKAAAGKHITYNYANITWSPYGPYWRQARKICLTELFSVKRLDSFEYIRIQEVNDLLAGLFLSSSVGQAINLRDHLSTVSLNVTAVWCWARNTSSRPSRQW